jgi:hypothetical protein
MFKHTLIVIVTTAVVSTIAAIIADPICEPVRILLHKLLKGIWANKEVHVTLFIQVKLEPADVRIETETRDVRGNSKFISSFDLPILHIIFENCPSNIVEFLQRVWMISFILSIFPLDSMTTK